MADLHYLEQQPPWHITPHRTPHCSGCRCAPAAYRDDINPCLTLNTFVLTLLHTLTHIELHAFGQHWGACIALVRPAAFVMITLSLSCFLNM
jgi:hypothetical protein